MGCFNRVYEKSFEKSATISLYHRLKRLLEQSNDIVRVSPQNLNDVKNQACEKVGQPLRSLSDGPSGQNSTLFAECELHQRRRSSSRTLAPRIIGNGKYSEAGILVELEMRIADSHRKLANNLSKRLILIDLWKVQLPLGLPRTWAPG